MILNVSFEVLLSVPIFSCTIPVHFQFVLCYVLERTCFAYLKDMHVLELGCGLKCRGKSAICDSVCIQ